MRYIADDGKIFDNAKDCQDYEALFMKKERIIPFDGEYRDGVLTIGESRTFEPDATLSQIFNEVNILYIPKEIYTSLLEREDIPTEGLTIGINVWDDRNMIWTNIRVIKNELEEQLLDIKNAEIRINTLYA